MAHFVGGFTFIWKIDNFSMLPHQTSERLESPPFVVEFFGKTKWKLRLYPKGREEDSDKHISLFLCRCDWDTNSAASILNFTLAFESVNNVFEHSMSFEYNLGSKVKSRGYNEFIELKAFHDSINLYAPQDILTIGCHIWPSQEQAPATIRESTPLSNYFENQHSVKTIIDVRRRFLSWPITKISKFEKSKEKTSIILASSSEDSPALKLFFYINKTLNDKYARIEILQTKTCIKKAFFIKCKISVVSANRKDQISSQDSHLFSSNPDEIWHFPDFIIIENIDEYAYVDDTMFLQCEFAFSRKGSKHHLEKPMYTMPNAFPVKEHSESTGLNRKVQILLESKQFCDVELRAGDQSFPCHRLVLCAQSPVFSAMFENDMKEKESGVIEITDGDPKTLEKMLKFLYSEVIEEGLSVEEICELYSVADKYEVLLLQRRCSLLLLSKLCVESVCSILVTADTHQDHFLLTNVYNFLGVHAREVFCSPQWKAFMVDNPTLSRDTMNNIYMKEFYG